MATLTQILLFMKAKPKYIKYSRPYELNIVGVRDDDQTSNKFNDTMFVYWNDEAGKRQSREFKITTDPGLYYLNNPMNVNGTAMLKNGQMVNAFKIGYHKGYQALVQQKPVTVYRDIDRNGIFDLNDSEATGMFGINIHKAGNISTQVDKWSAGCQVFANTADFNEFMQMAQIHSSLYGNSFTYTLVDDWILKKKLEE